MRTGEKGTREGSGPGRQLQEEEFGTQQKAVIHMIPEPGPGVEGGPGFRPSSAHHWEVAEYVTAGATKEVVG